MKRTVFLDRDGVLNRAILRNGEALAPHSLDSFHILANATSCVSRLREAGLLTIVVTNQPEIGRGTLKAATVDQMHQRLRAAVPLDDIFLCPHREADACLCRKPKPGLLVAAAEKWQIGLQRSFLIGDRWRDIGAGKAAGCCTFLLQRPYSGQAAPNYLVETLDEAVAKILALVNSQSL
jgi:D-glycero-D-manno-heptose 1,7-bisphosphate phosphatase